MKHFPLLRSLRHFLRGSASTTSGGSCLRKTRRRPVPHLLGCAPLPSRALASRSSLSLVADPGPVPPSAPRRPPPPPTIAGSDSAEWRRTLPLPALQAILCYSNVPVSVFQFIRVYVRRFGDCAFGSRAPSAGSAHSAPGLQVPSELMAIVWCPSSPLHSSHHTRHCMW